MSLLFVGYDFESINWGKISGKANDFTKHHSGIFAIADSAITTFQGRKTLVTGFRKIYDLEARIWKPHFVPDGTFNGYVDIYSKHPIIVGFAGNTLVAQHILNSISGHIEQLKISCKHRSVGLRQDIEYSINLPCQKNELTSPILSHWDDDTFRDRDFEGLVTGELLSDTVEHSINHAIESARKHRLNEEEYNQMFTDIFCGIYCPKEKEHQIYVYRMKSKLDGGVLVVYTEKEKLPEDKIAVLGMRKQFESDTQKIYAEAIKEHKYAPDILEKYMGECIQKVHSSGSFEIDRPIVHKKLNRFRIEKKYIP